MALYCASVVCAEEWLGVGDLAHLKYVCYRNKSLLRSFHKLCSSFVNEIGHRSHGRGFVGQSGAIHSPMCIA
jgi:hypothetical protein